MGQFSEANFDPSLCSSWGKLSTRGRIGWIKDSPYRICIEYVYPRVKRSQVCKITMLKFSRFRRDHRQFSIVIMLVNVSLEGIYDIFAAYILRDVLQLPQGLMIPIKRLIFSR